MYCPSLTTFKRLITREVKIGNLLLGNGHPIRVQTMTTTDTMNTLATVEQSIRCIEAGAELVRITAPSKKEAENLLNIKNELRKRGYNTPLIADIHFTPNAAEIAARIIEKVRVNPGNYVDKKKFEQIDYTNSEYLEEIDRIRERFTPLVNICKEYGTAMRIGTNHGSLSDRIMSRYGDTPMGMVESAMEFLRIDDHRTGKSALRNPMWQPKEGEFKVPGIGPVPIGINELQSSGVIFCVCDMALSVNAYTIASKMNLDGAEIKKDFLSGILPGVNLAPSGLWALGRAQEKGCGYCFAG